MKSSYPEKQFGMSEGLHKRPGDLEYRCEYRCSWTIALRVFVPAPHPHHAFFITQSFISPYLQLPGGSLYKGPASTSSVFPKLSTPLSPQSSLSAQSTASPYLHLYCLDGPPFQITPLDVWAVPSIPFSLSLHIQRTVDFASKIGVNSASFSPCICLPPSCSSTWVSDRAPFILFLICKLTEWLFLLVVWFSKIILILPFILPIKVLSMAPHLLPKRGSGVPTHPPFAQCGHVKCLVKRVNKCIFSATRG